MRVRTGSESEKNTHVQLYCLGDSVRMYAMRCCFGHWTEVCDVCRTKNFVTCVMQIMYIEEYIDDVAIMDVLCWAFLGHFRRNG